MFSKSKAAKNTQSSRLAGLAKAGISEACICAQLLHFQNQNPKLYRFKIKLFSMPTHSCGGNLYKQELTEDT